MKTTTKLWVGLGLLIVISPLGLLLPAYLKAGVAWGEWEVDSIKGLVGYIPRGLVKLSSLWSAPIPDYAFKGWEEQGMASLSLAYIASAVIGVIIVVFAVLLISKALIRRKNA